MQRTFRLILLIFLLTGCAANTSVPIQTPAATAVAARIQSATPAPRIQATLTSQNQASPTTPAKVNSPMPAATADLPDPTQPVDLPVLTQTSGGLTVEVFSNSDVEVNEPDYIVSGRAPSGTVLSINDEIILVDQSQSFSTVITLEDGPNLIEIVASDSEGNEVSFMLTVSYNSESS